MIRGIITLSPITYLTMPIMIAAMPAARAATIGPNRRG